ncbi:right-handed parallel beta-helix repeat-containing protein [Actinoplanes hulinensis]|uniref:Right-handed parallel beta-helix repeat-containing protein n=1 Tax=Actinoplanes hulinensis TaxID=1144547 RepID=A0ABS7BCU1_9ACTN|nr:pectinesterase family protein [Actinoplanes hulinensis]MBW6438868.1 right-handed parallel beta-helix repeat-containing protein [Actinoplanes hulinensis]
MITAVVLAALAAIVPVSTTDGSTATTAGGTEGFIRAGTADGFAAGTTGGGGGVTVRATTFEQLRAFAAAADPLVVQVVGSIRVDPFGDMIPVASDKTIIGAGPGAEIVGGGLFLNGSHNVIIRNLTIRDSYIPGDFDGKSPANDNDGIRLDTADHVWIDHTRIERVGDGGIDIRKDSDHVTLSWNVVSDINKALGVGWTPNVLTRLTAHHNWIRNTVQRNWSIDNTAAAHLYNNYLENVTQYGTMSRNNARVLVEDSVFEQVNDPLVVHGAAAGLAQRRNILTGTTGRADHAGEAFEVPYGYSPDAARRVKDLVTRYAGPQPTTRSTPSTITVALDGSGDYGSLLAALGATRDARGPVTIRVAPGHYREQVRVWPSQSDVTIAGPADAVIAYDLDSGGQKFYGGPLGDDAATFTLLGEGTTVRGLTVTGTAAPAIRAAGDRTVLAGTRLTGFLAGHGRSYLRDCTVAGGGDLITGTAVAVLDRCIIDPAAGASVTAVATPARQPYGILVSKSIVGCAAETGTALLGRSGQVVVRESVLGPRVAAAPWLAGSGRFGEYANTGPGSGRPEMSRDQARRYTVGAYLGGWRPRT